VTLYLGDWRELIAELWNRVRALVMGGAQGGTGGKR